MAAKVKPEDEVLNTSTDKENLDISCLKNEIVNVKFIPKENGLVANPKHILYGGMADNATKVFTVPILESGGSFVNVLTNSEKSFLEKAMGLAPNALSIYLKNDNYWENLGVRLVKGDNYFNLAVPDEYIKYKVLLANKDYIAPSVTVLQEFPKSTYMYVVVAENEVVNKSLKALDYTMEAYLELGKIVDNKTKLKFIAETLAGRSISIDTKLDVLKERMYNAITSDAKMFISIIKDPLFDSKIFLQECIEYKLIRKRGDYLYLDEDNSPLCDNNSEPTLGAAVKYINNPKNQNVKFTLEAKLKACKD